MKQNLTAKLMNEKLKKGWTAEDFANHLEISIELFWDLMKKEFTRNAYEGFRSALNKNEKHHKRLNKISNHSTSDTNSIPEEIPQIAPTEESLDSNDTDTNTIDPAPLLIPSTCETKIIVPTLSELKQQRKTETDNLNALELQHRDLVSTRIEIRNKIVEHQAVLKRFEKEIAERQIEITALVTQLNQTAETMTQITSEIRTSKQSIEELDSQIEKAQKIYIYTCDSGEVEIDSKLDIEIPEWKPTFDTIVTEDELDSLTIKQLKALSKTITLVRVLVIQKIPYEVVFENKESELYFKKAIS